MALCPRAGWRRQFPIGAPVEQQGRARMMHVQRMHAAEHEMMVPRVVHRIYGAVDPGDGAVEHRGTERRGTMRHADELVRILRCEGAAQGLLIIAQDIDAETSRLRDPGPT